MGTKKMRIRIGLDGRTQIKVEGGQGGDCLDFTRAIERALGAVEQRELTADYQESDALALKTTEQLKEGGL